MEQIDGINIVKDIIQNAFRHKTYFRAVSKSEEYKSFITGEGMDEYLHKLKSRETDSEFTLRRDITVNITESITASIIDPQYKLPRSNSIERKLFYTDNSVDKHNTLTDILSNFYEGDKSVDDYMSKEWIELNNLDPNAFVVLDWKTNSRGERIRPYPVEYPSERVYHFNKKNGILQWVCLHREEEGADPEMYLLYTQNFTVIFKRKETQEWKNHDADILFYKEFPLTDYEGVVGVMKDKDDYYDIYILKPHNLGFVPGFFVGFVTDLYTRRSYLSPIHKAFPYLKKIVKINSELDITMSKHAFQQKVVYASPCPKCSGNGTLIEGGICPDCKGEGTDPRDTHESGLDVQRIPRPRDAQDLFDLSKLIHYVPADVKIPRFQYETLASEIRKAKEAVYNSNIYEAKEVTETAYAKNVDLQNVYDALWPMAQAYARTYTFIVKAIAKITDLDENLVHSFTFRKDFKMKSLTDLYNDLALLGQSSAEEFVKKEVEEDIAQIMYEDNERELMKFHTQRHFFPFNGKTKQEITLIVSKPNLCLDRVKVLWANFSFIFDELELDFKKKKVDFYRLSREQQKKALDKKVEEILAELPDEQEIEIDYGGETLQGANTKGGSPPRKADVAR